MTGLSTVENALEKVDLKEGHLIRVQTDKITTIHLLILLLNPYYGMQGSGTQHWGQRDE